ncbi:MAG: hypothetical protein IJ323_00400 [Clostridia bacterium]|nr:hypothetical protein [Clostridia bacterium]
MRNRIISMLLVLVMCASVLLTSCSDVDTGYEEDTSTIPAITLTLYGIKGEGTTDEAIARVQQELNRITEDKYKTTVELHFLNADEYDAAIEDAFVSVQEQTERTELAEKAATAAAKAARLAAKALTIDQQKEKKRAQREYENWNEARGESLEEISVTMSDDVQLDIFMVYDHGYFVDLIEREQITDISSSLTGSYGIITKYVNPLTLSVTKYQGLYYGVPSNIKLGADDNEGYYYAFRTDLVEKYGLELKEGSTPVFNSLDGWLEQVKNGERCVPFLAPPTAIQGFDFYNNDMENYPAYGTKNLESNATTSTELEFTFDIGSGMNSGVAYLHFKKMSKYRNAGFFGESGADPKTTDFAMGIFQGTLDEVKEIIGDKADEYSYYTYAYPKVTTKDAFKSVFAVSSSCKYPARAVQLIAGFSTNEELRNLITFGVENVDYEVNLDGETITKLTNDYNIDFEMYGNSLIGYVPEELGVNYQKDTIERNRNIKASAFIGYSEPIDASDEKAFKEINRVAGEYIEALMNGEPNIDEVLETATTRMGKYEDRMNLYPNEKDDEYVETYNLLLASLNSSFSNFAATRPGGKTTINQDIITKEEKERREAEAALLNPEVTEPEIAEGETVEETTEVTE